jgi:hypothetical protein
MSRPRTDDVSAGGNASTVVSTFPGARLAYAGDLAKYGVNRAGGYAIKATGGIPGFGLGQSTSMALDDHGCGC